MSTEQFRIAIGSLLFIRPPHTSPVTFPGLRLAVGNWGFGGRTMLHAPASESSPYCMAGPFSAGGSKVPSSALVAQCGLTVRGCDRTWLAGQSGCRFFSAGHDMRSARSSADP